VNPQAQGFVFKGFWSRMQRNYFGNGSQGAP
jgi:hypothetical protein